MGAYPEALARAGCIGIAACSGPPSGHWVAPFGGREGRISTNPIAFAWPVEGAEPAVADFSTAATAEGVVRSLRNRGLPAPDGMLRDAEGRPTSDPGVLYATPGGAIQPLGGSLGYRGTALALLAEVLTTLLSGESIDDAARVGTDMAVIAIVVPAALPGAGSPAHRAHQADRAHRERPPGADARRPGGGSSVTRRRCCSWTAPRGRSWRTAAGGLGLALPEAHPA